LRLSLRGTGICVLSVDTRAAVNDMLANHV
jgi:hypothetical protein